MGLTVVGIRYQVCPTACTGIGSGSVMAANALQALRYYPCRGERERRREFAIVAEVGDLRPDQPILQGK